MKTNKHKLSPKSNTNILIMIIAAVVLETTACIQYFYSREGIKKEAEQRALAELKKAELEINVICAQVEMAVQTMAMLAERDLQSPDSMFSITCQMVQRTPNMVGAAIAFKENYYPQYGKWFEAYCDKNLSNNQIGADNHDYFQSEWFNNGLTIDSCWWCEPYYDNAGAKEKLVSCSYPIRNQQGEIVGVALGDISLDHLQRISEYLQVYKNSYVSIYSGNGTDLVPSPDTISGVKYHIYEEDVDVTGWTMKIIIPDSEIYRELKRIGLIVTILMLIGLITLIFILYRSSKDTIRLININNQKQRMESELNIARKIQMAMLPKTFPPYHDCKDLNIFGTILPAKEVGGDLYDFYIRDNKLIFCIGDVSGKGVPAALVMAVTRSLFRTISAHENDPAKITTQINESMSEMNEQNMFVTFFIGILDLQNGQLNYCNAGHNSPVLLKNINNEAEILPTIPNLPIGILSGYSFTGQTTHINRNDTLFLYTDGLTEAENIEHNLFGEKRMLETIANWEKDITTKQQIEIMQQEINKFVGEAEQSDDLTMLSIRMLPLNDNNNNTQQTSTKHSIIMRNDIQQIPTLAEWIESLHIPDALNMTINLALEEAVTNVMLYAYPEDNGIVLIEAEKNDKQITFVISDSGIPFDPTKQADTDITLSVEERQIGGLGIHLVRQIMDDIKYERKDDKNILTLIKKL